ncbi:hypothetical protein PIB30_007052 [Stylosanthes scabra]|uniref:Uncharacterized protein n=1 Tax=Stylosanthes scabra TaxID=79078 RepID=A0ABU6Q5K9_9FABA|nr:hypothetical protein [Stylosanthes scabra]
MRVPQASQKLLEKLSDLVHHQEPTTQEQPVHEEVDITQSQPPKETHSQPPQETQSQPKPKAQTELGSKSKEATAPKPNRRASCRGCPYQSIGVGTKAAAAAEADAAAEAEAHEAQYQEKYWEETLDALAEEEAITVAEAAEATAVASLVYLGFIRV